MYSFFNRQSVQFSLFFVLLAAMVVFMPTAFAHHNTGQNADKNPTVDDVLDDPTHYVNEVVTLEGEVDRVQNSSSFFMEDDQDLFFEDQILVISVMPDVVRVDGELREGKLVSATGTVRMFNRSQLENEFGTINWGNIDADRLAKLERDGEPVLVMGATEFAARRVQQQAVVIQPAPTPTYIPPAEPEVFEPAPTPEPAPAVTEPEPTEPAITEPEPAETLPRTATPLPLIALSGLFALMAGFGIRMFRQ